MKPRLFYTIALFIVVCDQATKWLITQSIALGMSRPVLGPLLSLTHTQNRGGAFSLLQANSEVFLAVGLVAVVAMTIAYHRLSGRELAVSAALALALGGAVGNLMDRMRFGYVIDFFDVHVWPIFNIADSAITISILVLAWRCLRRSPQAAIDEPAARRPS